MRRHLHSPVAVVRTSIETTPATPASIIAAAEADFAAAVQLAAAGTLRASHVEEWANTLWSSGFDTDRRDVALAVNTSLYSILSSLRPDRPFSTSPGGLANDVRVAPACLQSRNLVLARVHATPTFTPLPSAPVPLRLSRATTAIRSGTKTCGCHRGSSSSTPTSPRWVSASLNRSAG
jgi:hypothetical protein